MVEFACIEQEAAILSVLLYDPSLVDQVTAAVDEMDFVNLDYRKLYRLLVNLHMRGDNIADIGLVKFAIEQGEYFERQAIVPLLARLNAAGAPANVARYVDSVSNASKLRRLSRAVLEAQERLTNPAARASELSEWIEAQVSAIAVSGEMQGIKTIGQCADARIAEIREARGRKGKMGVPTGLVSMDAMIGGLFPGELTILAARPGIGKTALALQVSFAVAKSAGPVLFVSLEMSGEELAQRQICGISQVDSRRIRSGEITERELLTLEDAAGELRQIPISIWDPPSATLGQIRAAARLMDSARGCKLLVVDFLTLIKLSREDRGQKTHEVIGGYAKSLKQLAKELKCPVLCLAQVNREAAKEKMLRVHHLKESGGIEEAADVVWLLQRGEEPNKALLDIAKHRHGEIGVIELEWSGSSTGFADTGAAGMANYDPSLAEWSGDI